MGRVRTAVEALETVCAGARDAASFDHGGRIGFEAVISAVEGTAYFDVTEENGRIGIAARGT